MNVLIANNRFFVSGGPERYMFLIIKEMEKCGHKIIPFSNSYSKNQYSKYSKYFMSAPVNANSIYYRDYRLSPLKSLKLLSRSIYSYEARNKVSRIIEEQKIEIAYLLAIANYISPSIIDVLKAAHVPVVLRLSDFNILCPSYLFLRDGRICEECLAGNYLHAIEHRCLQDSILVSAARAFGMYFHRLLNIYKRVDAFVAPSQFLKSKMVEGGFQEEKIFCIPSPIDSIITTNHSVEEDAILYIGRIAIEKGLEVLLLGFKVFSQHYPEVNLLIAGEYTPEQERLERVIKENSISGVHFVGFIDDEQKSKIFPRARMTVCPSLWYENTPMSIYESFAYGKPVIASRIGSLPEQVIDGVDGLLFKAGDPFDLAQKMEFLWSNQENARKWGKCGQEKVINQHSPSSHYKKLISLFDSLVNG